MNLFRVFIGIFFRDLQANIRQFGISSKFNVVVVSFFTIVVILLSQPYQAEAAIGELISDRQVKETVEPVTNVVTTQPVSLSVTNVIEEATQPITNVIEEITEPVKDVVEKETEPIRNVVENVFTPITGVVRESTKPAKKTIKPVADVVEQNSDPVADAAKATSQLDSDAETSVLQPVQEALIILDSAGDVLLKKNIEDLERKSEIAGSLKSLSNKEGGKNSKDSSLPYRKSLPPDTLMILPGQDYYNGFGNSSSGLKIPSSGTAFAIIRDEQLLKDLRFNSQIIIKEFIRSDQWSQAPPLTPPRILLFNLIKVKVDF